MLVANKCSDVMRCYEPHLPQTAFFHQKEPKSSVTLWITSLHGCFAAPEVGPWAITTFLGHIHKRKETSPISEAP